MKKFAFILNAALLVACANNDTEITGDESVHANANDTIVTNAAPLVLEGCYEMVTRNDTATLNLTLKDTIVTGALNYHWREKDWNDGFIKGVLRDDKIYADYTFKSEGLTSVREVIFKIENGMLVQGFGELTDLNGKIIFVNKDDLQYETIHPFVKVECKQ